MRLALRLTGILVCISVVTWRWKSGYPFHENEPLMPALRTLGLSCLIFLFGLAMIHASLSRKKML